MKISIFILLFSLIASALADVELCGSLDSCVVKIQSEILTNWDLPHLESRHLITSIRITLSKKHIGKIETVETVKSSGNVEFDNSVKNVIKRLSGFEFLKGLKLEEYERNFHTFILQFEPGLYNEFSTPPAPERYLSDDEFLRTLPSYDKSINK